MAPTTRAQRARLPLHTRLLTKPPLPQPHSPLFTRLPPEVRREIFSLALAAYPDPDPVKRYTPNTCYARPGHFSPRRCDRALLATCRAVYAEAWHFPLAQHEETHWLATGSRAPPEYPGWDPKRLGRSMARIGHELGTEAEFEIEALRLFAQMWRLEAGVVGEVLRVPRLRPRRLTLTVRHADWWFWEEDEPLRVEGQLWMGDRLLELPSSVREVCIELESLERKKAQVDEIARQMRERWFFRTELEEGLFADVSGGSDVVSRWTGSSTWSGKRWVRDETQEGRVDYYVVAVSFRKQHVVEHSGGRVSEEARRACEEIKERGFKAGRMRLAVPPGMKSTPPGSFELQRAPGQ